MFGAAVTRPTGSEEEGGPRGKHGFPREASEAKRYERSEASGDQDDLAVRVPLLELGERSLDLLQRVGRGDRDLDLP